MQKIPTMFVRDDTQKGHPVTNQIKPECQWVLDGEGIATAKLDGTNVQIRHDWVWKRQKPKERDYDAASYVPCSRDNPADQWALEAFDGHRAARGGVADDGIYELIGPKIQGNPHEFPTHQLVRVVPPSAIVSLMAVVPPRDFDGLREYFDDARGVVFGFEGIVFHHPDGRMAKIKRRDFGLPWPMKRSAQPEAVAAVVPGSGDSNS